MGPHGLKRILQRTRSGYLMGTMSTCSPRIFDASFLSHNSFQGASSTLHDEGTILVTPVQLGVNECRIAMITNTQVLKRLPESP